VKVGFFLVGTQSVDSSIGAVCAGALVQSVRRSMPGVPVVQMTDEGTAAVPGVDEVLRLPTEPLALLRMRHQSAVTGEWLFVDTDVYIQRDVRNVFADPFDIALTTRNWPHLKVAGGFTERMPFNIGVVFSRCPAFWADIHERLSGMSPEWQEWMGDQQAVCDLVGEKPKYKIAFLKGSRYNLPPAVTDDAEGTSAKMTAKASILHFKGAGRKAMMLDLIRREGGECA
jgi:hypothetical protein